MSAVDGEGSAKSGAEPEQPTPTQQTASAEQPTPTELVSLAFKLRPGKMKDATESDLEEALAEAFNVWKLAREVLARGGKTSDEAMRDELEKGDLARENEVQGDDVKPKYSIQEAWRGLGYKDTRGSRSFFELLTAAVKAGVTNDFSAGLIRDSEMVDGHHFFLLRKFKAERAAKKVREGGLAKAAKSAVK